MMRFSAITFALILASLPALAAETSEVFRCYVQTFRGDPKSATSLDPFSKARRKITGLLKQKEKYFNELNQRAPRIVTIEEEIGKSGQMNRGVYRVITSDGKRLILKIALQAEQDYPIEVPIQGGSSVVHSYDLKRSVVLQNVLHEFGFAPEVHGIYGGNQLRELLPELRRANPNLKADGLIDNHWVGILMDPVDNAWNVSKEPPPPGFSLSVPKKTIMNKLKEMDRVLTSLHIFEHDPQVAINPAGDVQLFDLEYTTFVENDVPLQRNSPQDIFKEIQDKSASSLPFGFKKTGNRLVQNKEEQILLQHIRGKRHAGLSTLQIAADLNNTRPNSNRGRKWTSEDIQRILNQNPD